MSNQGDDLWEGLEPPSQKPEDNGTERSTLVAIVAGVAVLLVMGTCALGVVFLFRDDQPAEPLPTLGVPTATVEATLAPTVAPDLTTEPVATTEGESGIPTPTIAQPAATATIATTIEGIPVERFAAPPIIDGVLSEWSGVPTTPSQHRVFSSDGWDGTDDLDAAWRLAWDEQNLYLAVEVEDDVHVQTQSGNQIFRGDSLDIQIDTNPAAGARRVNPQTFQIIFSPGNFTTLPPTFFRFQGTAAGAIVDAPATTIRVAAQRVTGGYLLEAAVPWAALNTTPRDGLVLGVALNANDNDTPDTAVQEVMMSHVSTRTLLDPSTWGTMTLTDR